MKVLSLFFSLATIPAFGANSCPAGTPMDCGDGRCCPGDRPIYCTTWATLPTQPGIFEGIDGPCTDVGYLTPNEYSWLKYYCQPQVTCHS